MILLGAGSAGWDERKEQTESLFNADDLRKNNVVVHYITKRDGGFQRLELNGIHIDIDFVDSRTISFYLRKPTTEEQEELEINWLTLRKLSANRCMKIQPTTRRDEHRVASFQFRRNVMRG
jgi:hypothetical protein